VDENEEYCTESFASLAAAAEDVGENVVDVGVAVALLGVPLRTLLAGA
jgi:hypothetical protein